MSVESRPNKLVKGLVLDTFHTDVDNTVATYALNSQLEDQEGNHFHYGSEVGTTFIKDIPDNHVVVGHINMERNETVLFTTDGTNSTIGILSRNDDMSYNYEIKVDDSKQTKKLGFKKEGYVRGVYRLLNGCDKVIYFVDGVNKDRRININQLDSYKLPTTASVASGIIFDDSLRATIYALSSATGNIQLIRLMSASPEATANVLANLSSGAELTKLLTASANGIGTALANLIRTANIVSSIEATGTSTVNVDIVRLLQSNVSAIGSVNAILEASQQGLVEIDVTLSGVASSTAILLRAALLEVNLTTEATTLANAILTRIINAQVQALANTESSAQISIPVNATVDATATTAANAILSYAINATVDAMAQTSATAQLSKVISASVDALADSSSELLIGLVLVSTNIAGSSASTADLYINRLLSSSVTAEGTTTVEALIAKLLESSTSASADNTTTDLLVSKLLASTVDGLANTTANLQLADLLSTSLSGTATADNLLDIITIILADPYIDNVSLLLQGDDNPSGVTQNNTFIDSSTNNFTITRNGNVTQGTFSPFDRALTNSGGSAYFDGTGDYLSTTANNTLVFGTSSYTVETWVYQTARSTTQWIIGGNSGFQLGINATGFIFGSVAGVGDMTAATTAIVLNTWTHVAIIRNTTSAGGVTYYINGKASGTATDANNYTFVPTLNIGTTNGNSGVSPLTGYLSNLRVVKGTAVYTTNFQPSTIPLTAITNTSLLLNFTNAAIFDGVKLNNVETVGNALITTTPLLTKFGTGAIAINSSSSSSSDYIIVPSNTIHNLGSSDFTIEFWLYVVSNPTTSAGLITRASNSGNTGYTIMYYPTGYVTFLIGTNTLVQTSVSSISTTTWTHIAFVRSGTSGRFFINGTQSGSTGTINNFTDASTPLAIGALNTATGWNANLTLTGVMDDIRITKGIARYNTTFTTPNKLSSLIPNYLINRSLRFSAARSTYLNRTPSVASSRTTWTYSTWIKRGNLPNTEYIIFGAAGTSGVNSNSLRINADRLILEMYNGVAQDYAIITTSVFRDISSWYHIVAVWDTTNAVELDRIRLYVNGIRITSFTSGNTLVQNTNSIVNSAVIHYIGGNTSYYDGYMAEVNFIDGQALTPTSFGELDLNLGTWIPKLYSGTYGTNGFRLKFSDITQLGEDFSGNLNNWTPNGFNVTPGINYDLMSDSPINADDIIGNYATINPLTNSSLTYANGNLQIINSLVPWHNAKATIPFSLTDKFYYEQHCTLGLNPFIGIGAENTLTTSAPVGYDTNSYAYGNDGNKYFNSVATAYGSSYTTNDVIGVAYNAITGSVWFSKNGVYQNSGNPVTGANPAFTGITRVMFPIASVSGSGSTTSINYNFGQRPFVYPIPTGFKTLNTFNLPTPTIGATTATQANKFMDVSLYSGTGAAQSIVNSGFKPDLVWIKNRTGTAASHAIYDINRGVTKQLSSDSTNAETTQATGLTSFDTTGFTIGALGQINTSGSNYIAWQWRAGGTPLTVIAGNTIPSIVSVNTTAGFSVITYTGNGIAGATIAHGLGVVPKMIIVKNRSAAGNNWLVYTTMVGNGSTLFLSSTNAIDTSTFYWNNTNPTSSVFSVGISSGTNADTNTYIAYAWAEIDGFSKFNSYVGNGSTDGTFVYTGFRPKFILIKGTAAATNWMMYNSLANTSNPVINELIANSTAAENSISSDDIDFLSNGFKLRSTNGNINTSTATYIYAAFGEFPFKYANAALMDSTKYIIVDYLIIGGGGAGGGFFAGGGGGAGGYRKFTSQTISKISYSVIVGDGGIGSINAGGNGGDSQFIHIANGGGGGAKGGFALQAATGGSGGGGGGKDPGQAGSVAAGAGNEGNFTPSEGNNGGNGANFYWYSGGGGGGSAGVGGAGAGGPDSGIRSAASIGGAGGGATSDSITGTPVLRAAGGGGAAFGTAGAGVSNVSGSGSISGNGGAGTDFKGGGGGGGGTQTGNGGNGGKGVVIIRWLTSSATITLSNGAQTDAQSYTDGSYSIREIRNSGTVTFS